MTSAMPRARVAMLLAIALASCAPPEDDVGQIDDELVVCARGATVQGIDVSSWQGTIDWDAVARSGIGFAIVRIGDGYYHDPQFSRNWSEARRVGLIRGAYQFFEPEEDPIAQADIVVAAVGRLGPGDLPVTIDVEAPSPGVSPATYTARIHTWVDRVTAGTGRAPIIYTGRYYWDPYVASSDFTSLPLWHAQYTSASCPNINDRWRDWAFWQYTSSGSIAGIGGRVDRDVYNGSLSDLRAFANSVVIVDADGDGSPSTEDCDDHDASRRPGLAERCDGVDNDCGGGVDEGLVRACGTDVGECVAGTETCTAGAWGRCVGAVDPVPELCDRLDNDCDGTSDDEQICEREEAAFDAAVVASSADSDVDGDGRADACAHTGDGLTCLASSSHGFDHVIEGPSIDDGDRWRAWSVRMADLDGDGRADVCARGGDHLTCWRSSGDGFDEVLMGPTLGEGTTSIELADVSGDGREDVCTRDASGLRCVLSNGHGFDRVVELAALSDAGGFADVIHYGTLRFGDVDGDGRADVCARDVDGVDCWPSDGDHFGERMRGPRWSDAAGFDALAYWSTIRVADVDGDGRDDVCARTPSGFRCVRSEGRHFGDELMGPALASGWDDASVFSTLRMGDVDGDGRADVCAREQDGARCWLFSGHGFDRIVEGPPLIDANGWSDAAYYRSFRLADIDGDGRADVCARASDGLRCYTSGGDRFDRQWLADAWSDASGLADPVRAATIRLAGGRAATSGAGEVMLFGGCSATGSPRPLAVAWLLIACVSAVWFVRRSRSRR